MFSNEIRLLTHHRKAGRDGGEMSIPSDKARQQEYLNRVFTARFHSHLDECEQCREHPFDLCKIGAILLRVSVQTVPDTNFGRML